MIETSTLFQDQLKALDLISLIRPLEMSSKPMKTKHNQGKGLGLEDTKFLSLRFIIFTMSTPQTIEFCSIGQSQDTVQILTVARRGERK